MNRILQTFIIILSFYFSSFGQKNYQDIFNNDLIKYTNAYNNKNWEVVASMIYPKLYTISPREAIIEQLKSIDSSGITLLFDFNKINKTSDIVTVGKESFCLLSYNCKLKISLSGKMIEAAETMKSVFQAQYKDGIINYDSTSHVINIDANLYMYAISRDKGKTWTYMEKNDSMSYIFDSLIPKKALKKFEKFK